jgi:beta-1,2-mannobiose phosphorylase / 1,2-beta-oligomannan phosphorylase
MRAGKRFICDLYFLDSLCTARLVAVLCATWACLAHAEDFPRELVEFAPYHGNPVFEGAGEGHWDARIRERGSLLKEGDVWRLWYTGYDGTREGLKMLGLATSRDGLRWERHPSNPIYSEDWVEDMQVVKHGDTYYMFAEGRDDLAQLLKSSDGVNWQRVGKIDVRLKNGEPIPPGAYGTPTALFEDERWFLFYERSDNGVWLATSKDMQVWRNVHDEPVLRPGPTEYDRDQVALNQVIKHNARFYAYYHGAAFPEPRSDSDGKRRPMLWSTGIAASHDLIHWKKYDKNPLQPTEANKSSGIVVHDGKQFRLYTMHDRVDVHFQTPPR